MRTEEGANDARARAGEGAGRVGMGFETDWDARWPVLCLVVYEDNGEDDYNDNARADLGGGRCAKMLGIALRVLA